MRKISSRIMALGIALVLTLAMLGVGIGLFLRGPTSDASLGWQPQHYHIHQVHTQSLFRHSGSTGGAGINQATARALIDILDNPIIAGSVPRHAGHFSNFATAPSNVTQPQGAVYIRLFDELPASVTTQVHGIQTSPLRAFTNSINAAGNSIQGGGARWWQVVYMADGTLTLLMAESYRETLFVPANNLYSGSSVRTNLLTDFDNVMGHFNHPTIANTIVMPNTVSWQQNQPVTPWTWRTATNQNVPLGDRVWIPSGYEMANTSTTDTIPANIGIGFTNQAVRTGLWQMNAFDRGFSQWFGGSTNGVHFRTAADAIGGTEVAIALPNGTFTSQALGHAAQGIGTIRPAIHLDIQAIRNAASTEMVYNQPLFRTDGINEDAVEALIDAMRGAANGADPMTASLTAADFSRWVRRDAGVYNPSQPGTLLVDLFDNLSVSGVNASNINALSRQMWQPVFLQDGILTLWMDTPYRASMFSPSNFTSGEAPNLYLNSVIRSNILNDFVGHTGTGPPNAISVLGNFNADVRNAIVPTNDVAWQIQRPSSITEIIIALNPAVPNNDLIWIPSVFEVLHSNPAPASPPIGHNVGGANQFSRIGQWQLNARDRSFPTAGFDASTTTWLRSPGSGGGNTVSVISPSGGSTASAAMVDNRVIRPAIHIDLRAIFEQPTVDAGFTVGSNPLARVSVTGQTATTNSIVVTGNEVALTFDAGSANHRANWFSFTHSTYGNFRTGAVALSGDWGGWSNLGGTGQWGSRVFGQWRHRIRDNGRFVEFEFRNLDIDAFTDTDPLLIRARSAEILAAPVLSRTGSTFTWNEIPHATGYRMSINNGFTWVDVTSPIISGGVVSYIPTSLFAPILNQTFLLQAISTDLYRMNSFVSNAVSYRHIPPPSAPVISRVGTTNTISWDAVYLGWVDFGSVGYATSYRIYRNDTLIGTAGPGGWVRNHVGASETFDVSQHLVGGRNRITVTAVFQADWFSPWSAHSNHIDIYVPVVDAGFTTGSNPSALIWHTHLGSGGATNSLVTSSQLDIALTFDAGANHIITALNMRGASVTLPALLSQTWSLWQTIPNGGGGEFRVRRWSTNREIHIELRNLNGATFTDIAPLLVRATATEQITIDFNANGGQGGVLSSTQNINAVVVLTSIHQPTRTHFTFGGWATSQANANAGIAQYQIGDTLTFDVGRTLWAVWTPIQYTVTFLTGAGGSTINQVTGLTIVGTNHQFTLTEAHRPTRKHFVFQGWSATSSAGPVDYVIGNTVSIITNNAVNPVVAGNRTLHAVWIDRTYTLNLDVGAGSIVGGLVHTGIFSNSVTPNIPTRTHFTFQGWSRDGANGTIHYLPNAPVPFYSAGNMTNFARTIHAVWQEITYTVTLNVGAGTITGALTHTGTFPNTFTPNLPTRTHFTFMGWSRDGANGAIHYAPSTLVPFYSASNMTGNGRTIFAVWQDITYTVTLNLGGGNIVGGLTHSGTFPNTFTPNNPTRTHFTFQGWSRDSANGTIHYLPGGSVPFYSAGNMVANGRTMYAVWQDVTYSVTLNVGAGSIVGGLTHSGIFPNSFTPNVPTRTHYEFKGWSRDGANGTIHYLPGASVSFYSAGNMIANGRTIFAVWENISFTVTLDLDGGTITGGLTHTGLLGETFTPNNPTRTHFTFQGWSRDGANGTVHYAPSTAVPFYSASNMTGNGRTIFAVWQDITYTVTLNLSGGTITGGLTHSGTFPNDFVPNTPTRTHFTFMGWSLTSGGAVHYAPGTAVAFYNTRTIFAVWEDITYTVTLDLNGGSITGNLTHSGIFPNSFTPNIPTRTHFTFQGWSRDGINGAVHYAPSTAVSFFDTRNIYAIWQDITYTVTLNLNGGTISGGLTHSGIFPNSFTPNTPTRTHFTFQGWSRDGINGVIHYAAGAAVPFFDTRTIYAIWQDITYTVTLNIGAGTITGGLTHSGIFPNTFTPNIPTRTHFNFMGWSRDGANGTVHYAPNAAVPFFSAGNMVANGRTIHAVWEDTEYTVTFNTLNALSTIPSETGLLFGGSFLLTVSHEPFLLNNVFMGWATSQGGAVVYNIGDTVTITQVLIDAGLTLWAVWDDEVFSVQFNVRGGTAIASEPGIIDDVITLTTAHEPTRTHFTFLGWATSLIDAEAGNFTLNAGNTVTITGNIVLYAVWQDITYSVTLDLAGGNITGGLVHSGIFPNSFTPNVPTRTHFTFMGWSRDGTTVHYAPSTAVSFFSAGNMTGNGRTIYAIWQDVTYTVTLNVGAGSIIGGHTHSGIFPNTFVPNEPTRTHFNFMGWSRDGANGTVHYAPTTAVPFYSTRTIFAVWQDITYTVTLNVGAGSITGDLTHSGTSPNSFTPNVPTQTHFNFMGWSRDGANGTVHYAPSTAVPFFNTRTIYAVWQDITYTVTLNVGAGSITGGLTHSGTFPNTFVPNEPTRTHFNFVGWSRDSATGSVHYLPSATVPFYSTRTIFAVWQDITYTVTLDIDAGTITGGLVHSGIFPNSFIPNLPSRTHFTFQGWSRDGTNGTVHYAPNAAVSFFSAGNMTGNGRTIYAVWQDVTYNVTLNIGSGTITGGLIHSGIFPSSFTPNIPTMANAAFMGWSRTSGGTVHYAPSAPVPFYSAGNMIGNDRTIFAIWQSNMYTVTLDIGAGNITGGLTHSGQVGQSFTPNLPTRTHFNFIGWSRTGAIGPVHYAPSTSVPFFSAGNMTGNGRTIFAVWEDMEYTVTLNVGTGTIIGGLTHSGIFGNSFVPSLPSRDHFTFAGWSRYGADGTVHYAPSTAVSFYATRTVFAVWNAVEYTITFNSNGGGAVGPVVGVHPTASAESNLNASFVVTDPAHVPTRSNNIFMGWQDGVTLHTVGSTIQIFPTRTLTAQWSEIYTVTLDANGGSPNASITGQNLSTHTLTHIPIWTHRQFLGWAYANNATTPDYLLVGLNSGVFTVTGTQTLYAVWGARPYTVQFDSRGGSNILDEVGVHIDLTTGSNHYFTVTAPRHVPFFQGHEFLGWATSSADAVAGIIEYELGDDIQFYPNRTLWAIWHRIPVQLNTPTSLEVSGSTGLLTWVQVNNSTGYRITISNIATGAVMTGTSITNSFNMNTAEVRAFLGNYTSFDITVTALGNGTYLLDSFASIPHNIDPSDMRFTIVQTRNDGPNMVMIIAGIAGGLSLLLVLILILLLRRKQKDKIPSNSKKHLI